MTIHLRFRSGLRDAHRLAAYILFALSATFLHAQSGYRLSRAPGEITRDPAAYGAYNVNVLAGGVGLIKPLVDNDSVTEATSAWSLYGWVYSHQKSATQLLVGIGESTDLDSRYIGTLDGKLMLRLGEQNLLTSNAELPTDSWHFIAVTNDGDVLSLYLDGQRIAQGSLLLGAVRPLFEFAPAFPNRVVPTLQLESAKEETFGPSQEQAEMSFPGNPLGTSAQHFGGKLAGWMLIRAALSATDVQALHSRSLNFAALAYEDASKAWPFQTHSQAGYRAPQDPSTLPHSNAPFSKPVAVPLPSTTTSLEPAGDNSWLLRGGWKLVSATQLSDPPGDISAIGYHTINWMTATVPGTVLTTMVDRGIYPDPDYGLNNMAIPEDLNKQSYWYRTEFVAPQAAISHHLTLTFEGINYAAEVWLNGQRLGDIRGAFVRGQFDVTDIVRPNKSNALAVHISPPPHPGIPNEQSIRGGPGENGGSMLLDGPTFVATEGWDWVPAIRDRDTGIWQDVRLTATHNVSIGDPQVITRLPLPRTNSATVQIDVSLHNAGKSQVSGTYEAAFEGVVTRKQVTLEPGDNKIELNANDYPELHITNPRLWWPNGYGKPELYHMKLSFTEGGGQVSDTRELQFGIREITYELSLFDSAGQLRRVAITPAEAHDTAALVDVTHNGIREVPTGWAYSLASGAEHSAAIQTIQNTENLTQLVVRVNGVRIAARGGNWGMDDARKRVGRERLEPYFRLHRDAGLNIIRNWVGQSTEETFYDLADEYGLMVWNDFWESTQDYNIEAQDSDLFLKNAEDVIQRYRNHPSILLWCGRNEGVPQPLLNEELDKSVREQDGTRYYAPSSNSIDLQVSGPYHYQDPVRYYTILNRGFSVETGTPSMPTLESFRSFVAPADQWPISDSWAYHDWHASGNGDTAPFMDQMTQMFGAAANLEDFERKAQLMNYVDHRAIFEGFNAHLWSPNSGRMLWMTQPAWPSTMWQILSSDYDTQASYYGVKKACEPLHVQLDLDTHHVQVVNTTTAAAHGLKLMATVYDVSGKMLDQKSAAVEAADNSVTDILDLNSAIPRGRGVSLIELVLSDFPGSSVSRNFYWLSDKTSSFRQLSLLPHVAVDVKAVSSPESAKESRVAVTLTNHTTSVAIATKITLLTKSTHDRILPAYYSDNYISLLPGETQQILVAYPHPDGDGEVEIAVGGWNIVPQTIIAHRQ